MREIACTCGDTSTHRIAYREAADEAHNYGICRDCGRVRLRSET